MSLQVANKIDQTRLVKERHMAFHIKKNMPLCNISVKTSTNYDEPFLMLAHKLLK